MSPEQVRGNAVDHRSDQFSFGLVLYEMATGKRAFPHVGAAESMAAILRDEPRPIQELTPSTPMPMRWIIERCLAKDPASRYAATMDLHHDLLNIRSRLPELSARNQDVSGGDRRVGFWAKVVAATLCAATGAFGLYFLLPTAEADLTSHHYSPFATESDAETRPVWSADGKTIAYARDVNGISQIYARSLDADVPTRITTSRSSATDPFWAPDGSRIYYTEANALWWAGRTGGAPQRVIANAFSGAFSPDGKTLAFFRRDTASDVTLWTASHTGEDQRLLERPSFPKNSSTAELGSTGIRYSPDGTQMAVLLVGTNNGNRRSELWVLPQPEGTPRRVLDLPSSQVPAGMSWVAGNRDLVVSLPGSQVSKVRLQLHSINTRTGGRRTLTAAKDMIGFPSVSPGFPRWKANCCGCWGPQWRYLRTVPE